MRQASDALKALLASDQFIMADLFTFTLVSGVVLTYTNADVDLVLGGTVFSAAGTLIERQSLKMETGMTVDSMQLSLYAGMKNLVSGEPILQEITIGAFDNAKFTLQRVFMPVWGDTSAGAVTLFTGYITDAQATRTSATLTAKTYLNLLNISMPRNLYQASCDRTLFDAGCGVDRSRYAVAATVGAGSTKSVIVVSSPQAAGWFSQGYVTFTSGQNANTMRTIKSSTPSRIVLAYPLPYVPAAGDTLTLYPGCDHTQAGCAKFGNTARFRAMPYIPVPETAT